MTEIILRSQALKWRKQWKDRQRRWRKKWDAQLDKSLHEIALELKDRVNFGSWDWADESEKNREDLSLIIMAVLRKFDKNPLSPEQVLYFIDAVLVTGTLNQLVESGQIQARVDFSGSIRFYPSS